MNLSRLLATAFTRPARTISKLPCQRYGLHCYLSRPAIAPTVPRNTWLRSYGTSEAKKAKGKPKGAKRKGKEKAEPPEPDDSAYDNMTKEEMIAELRRKAAELATRGIHIDVEDTIRRGEEFDDENAEPPVIIDIDQVEGIKQHAKDYWRVYKDLPRGWSCDWEKWENLFTFYYTTDRYFVAIPQIAFMINIRYGIPGDVRPVMFNNETEAFMFEVVERRFDEDGMYDPVKKSKGREEERHLYYLDWQEEELYKIHNARTVRDVAKLLVQGGLEALHLVQMESDEEGEAVADRLLALDDTVLPVVEKYLGYMPPPSEELADRITDEAEELVEEMGLGSVEEELMNIDPELEKESDRAYQELLHFIHSISTSDEQFERSRELLETMRLLAPEELGPMVSLFKLIQGVNPQQIPIVADELRKHYSQLHREVQADAQVLGQVLADLKKEQAGER